MDADFELQTTTAGSLPRAESFEQSNYHGVHDVVVLFSVLIRLDTVAL